MAGSGSCAECASGCLICDEDGCIECLKGFHVSNGQCAGCGAFCDECSSGSVCSECQLGYVLPTGEDECVECLLGCIVCSPNDLTQCVECSGGYYDNNGQCALCPDSCSQCTS